MALDPPPAVQVAPCASTRRPGAGTIDRRLSGGFGEHLGRCVDDGIHEPGHPTADTGVVVGGLLISLLRHADRVRSPSRAQLVNVIAPIMTCADDGSIAVLAVNRSTTDTVVLRLELADPAVTLLPV